MMNLESPCTDDSRVTSYCIRILFLIIISTLCVSIQEKAAAESMEIRIQFPSYSTGPAWDQLMINNEGSVGGILPSLVSCSFKRIGARVVFSQAPFARIQRDASSHMFDGFFPATKTLLRSTYFSASTIPLINDYKVLVTPANLSESEPLMGQKVISPIGAARGADMEVNIAKELGDVTITQGYRHLLFMLSGRRLNSIVASELFFNAASKDMSRELNLPTPLRIRRLVNAPIYLFFDNQFLKVNRLLLDRFSEALSVCQKESQDFQKYLTQ